MMSFRTNILLEGHLFFIYPIFPPKIRAYRLFFCAPFVLVTFAGDRTVVSFR